ncbi:MAG: putative pyridoxine 5'-phosphate oxidase superfamily flavin-nucleotide-binding protein [Alteromonadaceae bacterium]|jgi:predicted pyridoxine 5'-phosphate oxidase superfamily flavin-nucleotide-binding protein
MLCNNNRTTLKHETGNRYCTAIGDGLYCSERSVKIKRRSTKYSAKRIDMNKLSSDIAFTPSVKEVQQRLGSRRGYANMEFNTHVTPDLVGFLAGQNSFYMATVNDDGQPYIQHRGGAPGFLKALDNKTLAFADFSGNKQYISMGNLKDNNKAHIFVMDYASRSRVKIWGTARFEEDDKALIAKLHDDHYRARPERALVFTVDAWDSNCPQHITPRFTEAQVMEAINPLKQRIAELEKQLAERK